MDLFIILMVIWVGLQLYNDSNKKRITQVKPKEKATKKKIFKNIFLFLLVMSLLNHLTMFLIFSDHSLPSIHQILGISRETLERLAYVMIILGIIRELFQWKKIKKLKTN